MPTANANTGAGFHGALSYIHQEIKVLPDENTHKVLTYNNVSGSTREIAHQMIEIAKDRSTVKKPVLHLQINFHPEEKISETKMKQAIDSIIKEIDIENDNHLYACVLHRNRQHIHAHIVACRVGLDATLINDHRILDRLQIACDKVEKTLGLRPTMNRTVIWDPTDKRGFKYIKREERSPRKVLRPHKNPKVYEVRSKVHNAIKEVLLTASSQAEFEKNMNEKGIDILFNANSKGIQGIAFKLDNISVSGTKVLFKWSRIEKHLLNNESVLIENKTQCEIKAILKQNKEVPQDASEKDSSANSNSNAQLWHKIKMNIVKILEKKKSDTQENKISASNTNPSISNNDLISDEIIPEVSLTKDNDIEKGSHFIPFEPNDFVTPINQTFDKEELQRKLIYIQENLTHGLTFCKTAIQFGNYLLSKSIKPVLLTNTNGIYGIKFIFEDIEVKGSDLGYKWSHIQKNLNDNSIANENKGVKYDTEAAMKRIRSKGDLEEIEHTKKFKLRL